MIHETILAIIIAFAISALLCPIIIPFLHKLKFGQQVRDDGPQSHLKKQGTPTMGGLIILCSIIITSIFYIPSYWNHRFSGRLYQDCAEALRGAEAHAEVSGPLHHHRHLCLVPA